MRKSKFTDHTGTTNSQYDIKQQTAGRLALLRQAARENGGEYVNDKQFQGYTKCGCNAPYTSGIVLDPFAGSGTTLAVAERLSRKWLGIELNPSYITMAYNRIREFETPLLNYTGGSHGI